VDVRVALGPAGQVPCRAQKVEQHLRGQAFTPELVSAVVDTLAGSVEFRTSPRRATSAYRHHLASVLLSQLLYRVWDAAGANQVYR